MNRFSRAFVVSLLSVLALVVPARARAEDKPSIIRFANPGVGVGNRPVVGGSAWNLAHIRGLFEQEFRKDGIEVRWSFLRGAGPAVNELFANNLVDVAGLGDLPSVVGKSGGLKTRVLLATGRGNLYIAVPSDSSIKTVQDLRGKKVGIFKGTATQLGADRILASFGLSEHDLRAINVDTNTGKAAILTKDLDAIFGGSDLIALRDQGVARIIFSTRGGDPKLQSNGSLVVAEDFLHKYPSIVKRIVRTLVLSAKWLAETDRTQVFQLWAKSGVPFSNFKEDFGGDDIKLRSSPVLDPYIVSSYKRAVEDSKRYGLLRNNFSVEEWFDPTILNEVLKEEHLENFWPVRPAP
ncbi:MAG: ABC transporter substrate-binding protein [Pseudomonadota bacterium]